MQHLILLFHVVCFASGMAALTVVFFINQRYKNRTIKYYLYFMLIFTLFISINLVNTYRFTIINDSNSYLSLITGLLFFLCFSLLYKVIPMIFLTLFQKSTKITGIIFWIITLISFGTSYLPFILKREIVEQIKIMRFLLTYYYFTLFLAMVIYIFYLIIMNMKYVQDSLVKKILITFLIFSLIFIPGFIVDANFYHFLVEAKLLPFGLSFTSLFYLGWNCVSIFFAFQFLLAVPAQSGPAHEIESPVKEPFYLKYKITGKEKEVLRLLIIGKANKEIASDLSISHGTVKNHISKIYEKTSTSNRVELVNLIKVDQ